jgi:hypothetical protein
MKAIVIRAYGGPEELKFEESPDPVYGLGEVLVRVVATSANQFDWKIRSGAFKDIIPLTFPGRPLFAAHTKNRATCAEHRERPPLHSFPRRRALRRDRAPRLLSGVSETDIEKTRKAVVRCSFSRRQI